MYFCILLARTPCVVYGPRKPCGQYSERKRLALRAWPRCQDPVRTNRVERDTGTSAIACGLPAAVTRWARSQNCEKRLFASCLSVRPSAWNDSAPTGRILHEIWDLRILSKILREYPGFIKIGQE